MMRKQFRLTERLNRKLALRGKLATNDARESSPDVNRRRAVEQFNREIDADRFHQLLDGEDLKRDSRMEVVEIVRAEGVQDGISFAKPDIRIDKGRSMSITLVGVKEKTEFRIGADYRFREGKYLIVPKTAVYKESIVRKSQSKKVKINLRERRGSQLPFEDTIQMNEIEDFFPGGKLRRGEEFDLLDYVIAGDIDGIEDVDVTMNKKYLEVILDGEEEDRWSGEYKSFQASAIYYPEGDTWVLSEKESFFDYD